MSKINTAPLSGFMELLPNEQIAFDQMLYSIIETYELFGFRPINTPIIERTKVLLAKGGGDTDKQIYRFKKGSSDLSLRFDLTVPLARYVADKQNNLTFPFKRYAVGKVFRGEKPQAGRFREFYQCDIDVIGNETLDLSFDAEIPAIIVRLLKGLNLDNFTIRINNRKILNGILEECGNLKVSKEVLKALDNLEKEGIQTFKNRLEEILKDKEKVNLLLKFISLRECDESTLFCELKKLQNKSEVLKEGIFELETVVKEMKNLGVDNLYYEIDLSIARGLDYYTGTVYETTLNDFPEIGSICSGGRYDDLTAYYTKKKFPGVGISIGLTRLFDQLNKKGLVDTTQETKTKVLILQLDPKFRKETLVLAKELRERNIATETYSDIKGLKYANDLNIPFAIFIGEEEINSKEYSVKNLKTRQQVKITKGELFEYLSSEI
jgi:histidyl-tRNA synthetase